MGSSGTSGSKTTYTQSPEQRELYGLAMPVARGMLGSMGYQYTPNYEPGQTGTWAQTGQQTPLWNVPEMPQYGAMPTFNAPGYGTMPEVPKSVLPTAGWMQNLGPEIMSGIMEPYKLGEQQLMETLGSQGQLGTAAGGFAGQGAAGLGKYWGTVTPGIGLQAWGMVSPELQRYGQQTYEQGMLGREQEYSRQALQNQMNYQAAMMGREQEYARQLGQRQDILGASQAPYQILPTFFGAMSPTFSQGVTTQPQNWWERYAMPFLGAGAQGAGAYGMSKLLAMA